HAEPLDSVVRADARALEAAGRGLAVPWLRRLNPAPTDPSPALIRVLEGHDYPVTSVALSADGRTALSGSDDYTVRIWDLATGRCTAALDDGVTSVALAADGRTALFGCADGPVPVWNLATARCTTVLNGHTDTPNSVALSGDGRIALSG